jgi:hypothetical protein
MYTCNWDRIFASPYLGGTSNEAGSAFVAGATSRPRRRRERRGRGVALTDRRAVVVCCRRLAREKEICMTARLAASVAALIAAAAPGAIAQEANFDGFAPGFLGRSFFDGGITFSENLWFPGGVEVQFGATRATGSLGAYPEFTPENVMTTGSWSTGTSLGYTRTHQWIATAGGDANFARVDVWWITGVEWQGTEVSLEGLVGETVVVADTFIHPGASGPPVEHTRMMIEGVEFERIRLICRGGVPGGDQDGILAVFDNVVIDAVSGCRADLDGDGELTFFDFLTFQDLFAAGDLKADFTGDGELDFFDFLAFQDEFAAGCP